MKLDFDKVGGLIPAIIQDNVTNKVLMLGYMNEEALNKTQETRKVTFFSRTKQRLWTKGEESGNFLHVISIKDDCDHDTLLIKVNPVGPVCHTGADTCFEEDNKEDILFSPGRDESPEDVRQARRDRACVVPGDQFRYGVASQTSRHRGIGGACSYFIDRAQNRDMVVGGHSAARDPGLHFPAS